MEAFFSEGELDASVSDVHMKMDLNSEFGTSCWDVESEGPNLRWIKTIPYRYNAGSSVPKYDPFLRSVVKKASPSLVSVLEETRCRSPITPSGIARAIGKYGTPGAPLRRGDLATQVAMAYTRKLFTLKQKIKPLEPTLDVVRKTLVGSSNPGYPLVKLYKEQRECYEDIHRMMFWQLNKWREAGRHHSLPCMVSTRPGMLKLDKGDEEKLRGVWMYPSPIKAWEMMYVTPAMEHFKDHPLQYPYVAGINMLKQIPPIIDHLLRDGHAVCYDATAADTRPGVELCEFVLDVIRHMFDLTAEQDEVFSFLAHYFIFTPILMPNGRIYLKRGKVPSGSGFTQLFQTIVNTFIVARSCFIAEKRLPHQSDIFGVGDDIAFRLDHYGPHFLDLFTEAVRDSGYECHKHKVIFTDDPRIFKFLGHQSHGGHVYRSWDDISVMLLFPERFLENNPLRSQERLNGLLVDAALSCPEIENIRLRWSREHGFLDGFLEPWPSTFRFFRYVLGMDYPSRGALLSQERIFTLT